MRNGACIMNGSLKILKREASVAWKLRVIKDIFSCWWFWVKFFFEKLISEFFSWQNKASISNEISTTKLRRQIMEYYLKLLVIIGHLQQGMTILTLHFVELQIPIISYVQIRNLFYNLHSTVLPKNSSVSSSIFQWLIFY